MSAAIMRSELFDKKSLTILGVNSGTSADGVDLATIRFIPERGKPAATFISGRIVPYPAGIKSSLERAITDSTIPLDELARLDMSYGTVLGNIAADFIRAYGRAVDLIASHGQTIGHFPRPVRTLGLPVGATLQIGDGNALAVAAGVPVVSDFRRADIALGGEGAPLTPFVNHILFGHPKKSRIVINIGGIANFSYHPAGTSTEGVRGGDCGPGNVLSDTACRMLFHKSFDRDGRLAYAGKPVSAIIDAVVAADRNRRVSAGREQFNRVLFARLVHIIHRNRIDYGDLVTSAAEATVRLIHRKIRKYLRDPRGEGIYLTGGGRKNLYMVERLQKLCRPVPVWPIEALGFDGDLLEAVSFAVLGGCFVSGLSSTLPHVTGAHGRGIAGKLSFPAIGMEKG